MCYPPTQPGWGRHQSGSWLISDNLKRLEYHRQWFLLYRLASSQKQERVIFEGGQGKGTNPGVLTDQKRLTPLSFSVRRPAFVSWSGYQNNALHSTFSNSILQNSILQNGIFSNSIWQKSIFKQHIAKGIFSAYFSEAYWWTAHSQALFCRAAYYWAAQQSSIILSSIAYQGSIYWSLYVCDISCLRR